MRVRALLALMALVILLPVVVLSAAGLAILLKAERDAARSAVRETARAIALSVDRELATAEAALRVLATSRYLAIGDLQGFHAQATQARTSEQAWIVLFDKDAEQVVNTRAPLGTKVRRSRPEIVTQVIASQKTSVSDLYVGTLVQKPVVTVDVPVPIELGQRYVLAQAFHPEYFNRTFTERALPDHWILGLFDGDGITIARSHRATEFVGTRGSPELVAAMRRSEGGGLQHPTRDGIEVHTEFIRSARSGWSVAVGVPIAMLEAPSRRAVTVAGLGVLVALAAAGIVAFFLGRRLADAIAATERSAAVLGRGQMPNFRRSRIDEIDRLQATLAEAGAVLLREQQARATAEAERSRLLHGEQAARHLAEAQNESKDEFLAMLGHELRNPLAAISGAIGIMESGAARPEAERYAREVIARQSRHLSRIVDDLLDVSRVMTGKIRLDLQRVDLGEAAWRCVSTLDAAGRKARHEIDVRSVPAWIDADVTRLDQMICNLLINAVKYTPDGGDVRVEVRIEDEEAVLLVRDSGVGIPAALLPRIFDVFVQGAASLDRGQGGLGVGLSLVQRLVQMHGGAVNARSAGEGRGSEFTLRFPRRPAPAPAQSDLPVPPSRAAQGLRVLVVDDLEDARRTLAMLLEMQGLSVFEAADGVAAVKQAQKHVPDIAVVDIGLPGIDGYEVARRLRADPSLGSMKLIALTGYGQDDDRRRALEAGFDEHLVKPVDPDVLVAAMERLCRPG